MCINRQNSATDSVFLFYFFLCAQKIIVSFLFWFYIYIAWVDGGCDRFCSFYLFIYVF